MAAEDWFPEFGAGYDDDYDDGPTPRDEDFDTRGNYRGSNPSRGNRLVIKAGEDRRPKTFIGNLKLGEMFSFPRGGRDRVYMLVGNSQEPYGGTLSYIGLFNGLSYPITDYNVLVVPVRAELLVKG